MCPATLAPARVLGDPHVSSGRSYARRKPEASDLYQIVQQELETFLAGASARERPVPRFVAFSCKGRGFCPSCGGRRMADTAAHLVDRVLPEVPVRQWVLSLPFALRYRLAYDAPLVRDVLDIFVRSVFASLLRKKVPGVRLFLSGCLAIRPVLADSPGQPDKNNLTPGT